MTTGAGNPGKYVEFLKTAGVKVLSVVSSVNLARRQASGVDAVIAEGMNAAAWEIGSMPLYLKSPMR